MTPLTFADLPALGAHGFDTMIDVRSPAEYAHDHIPGAISLPVLSDAERAQVGTVYSKVSPFAARKLGAALVARNAATHIETALAGCDGSWRPLVYCWRGGQRSASFASILTQIGWRAQTLAGGYRSFRRLVTGMLYDRALPHRLILLDGYTGTAKTALLPLLAAQGVQLVDLEGLARHRGSMLGAVPDGQPSQPGFESGLAMALARLDPVRPVLVEAESSRIGRLNLPAALWSGMCAAPRIAVTAAPQARAAYLARAYADVLADPDRLSDLLDPLRAFRGHKVVDQWQAQLRAGQGQALALALMTQHYDPAYAASRLRHGVVPTASVDAGDLGPDALARVAARIAGLVSGM